MDNLKQELKFDLNFHYGQSVEVLASQLEKVDAILSGKLKDSIAGFNAAMGNIGKANTPAELIALQKEIDKLSGQQEKLRQAAIKTVQEEQKVHQIKAKAAQEIEKLNQIRLKTEKELEAATKKKIVLTDKEIAQAKIDSENKAEQLKLLKASLIEMDKTVGSLKRVEAANVRLRIERSKVNTTTFEGRQRLLEINAALDKNNEYIQKNSDKLKQQSMNVGNYTESINKAFEGTGILGEGMRHYLSIVTLLIEKVGLLTGATEANTASENLSTAATEKNVAATVLNTASQEKNAEATLAATEAERLSKIALEEQALATEAATVATGGLTKALEFLKANPIIAVIAGIVAVGAALYETASATQAGRDELSSLGEQSKNTGKALLLMAASAGGYGVNLAEVVRLTREMVHLEHEDADQKIKNLPIIARLGAEAAEARLASAEDGITTQKRIELMQKYIEKTKEMGAVKLEQALDDVRIAEKQLAIDAELHDPANREDMKKLKQAEADLYNIREENKAGMLRGTRMLTTLIQKDREERISMLQDAMKRENDLIDNQRKKDLAKEETNFQIDKDNLTRKQKELGATTAAEQADFDREQAALVTAHLAKIKEINDKADKEALAADKKVRESVLKEAVKEYEAIKKVREQSEKDELASIADKTEKEIEASKKAYEAKIQQINQLANNTAESQKIVDEARLNALAVHELEVDRILDQAELRRAEARKKVADASIADALQYNQALLNTNKNVRDIKGVNSTEEDLQKQRELLDQASKLKQEKIQADYDFEKSKLDQQLTDKEISARQYRDFLQALDIGTSTAVSINKEQLKQDKIATILHDPHLNRTKKIQLLQAIGANEEANSLGEEGGPGLSEDDKKQLRDAMATTDAMLKGVQDGLNKKANLIQSYDDMEIERLRNSIDVQAKLAGEGKENVLAEEQARLAKAEEKKIQDQKKAQREKENLELAMFFLKLASTYAEKGEKSPEFKALAETLVAKGIAKSFSGFYEGTEAVQEKDSIMNLGTSRDNLVVRVHPKERIMGVEHSKKMEGVTNKEVVAAVSRYKEVGFNVEDMLKNPVSDDLFKQQNISFENTVMPSVRQDSRLEQTMNQGFDRIVHSIENQPTLQPFLGPLGEWTDQISRKNLKISIHHLKGKRGRV